MTANGTASSNITASVRDGPIRWLIVGGAFLIVAIMVGTTIMAGNFRERALNSSKRELENTVLLLARHFDQQLDDLGAIQKDLIAYMRSSGIATSEIYKRRMSGQDIHLMLKSKLSALAYVGSINIFDADGALINASSVWPIPPVNVADRPYFKAFKNDPRSPEMLVEPVHSRITGAWTTVIARKVTGPNGEFLGAVGRGIEPANFEKFFASLTLGDDAVISMLHRDGTLLARYPHVESMIGQNFLKAPLFQKILSNGFGAPVEQFSDCRCRDDNRIGRARGLAGTNQISDRRGRPLRSRHRQHVVSRRSQIVAATSIGKAAPRCRREQYSAGPCGL